VRHAASRTNRSSATKQAIIVVDVQRDFCDGGALPAKDTKSLLEPLSTFISAGRKLQQLIVFTFDWHPTDHASFRQSAGRWPVHCVANTAGAELAPPLRVEPGDITIRKGVDKDSDGYSAFQSSTLSEQLQLQLVGSVAVCGIATEHCVKATALDAATMGFRVAVITDLIRAVDPSTVAGVFEKWKKSGVELMTSSAWINSQLRP
jgi:nicotinamidase/pyrazinamidase